MAKGKAMKYSPMETKLLALLKKGRKLTISEIVERVYDHTDAPYYSRQVIYATLHRLGAKIEFNREPISLYKEGGRNGPLEASYWME